MSKIHGESLRNLRITFFCIHENKKSIFLQMQALFFPPTASFWQFNSSQLRLWLNLSTSFLWARPNVLVSIAKPKPPSSAGRGSCVWPSILAGPTNWLIIPPHGAGGGAGRGLCEERFGLAIGCHSTQLNLILNSDWLGHVHYVFHRYND